MEEPGLVRYRDLTRVNHWMTVLLFMCAGLSGLAFFHPSLFFLTNLFGGGSWSRILHPFFGLVMVASFAVLFVQMWRENLWAPRDTEWTRRVGTLLKGDEDAMPPVGRYNAGQKIVFWVFALCLFLLLVTGFMFWRPWFVDAFPIPVRRVAVVVHAAAAFVLVVSVIVHAYAGIWVKGSVRAMTRGRVSQAWARKHHLLWWREVTGRQ